MSRELIAQGAEARVYRTVFMGRDCICKERFPKKYRLPVLDHELTQRRMKQEIRSMSRCKREGIDAPCVYYCDEPALRVYMELVPGPTVKQFLFDATDDAARLGIANRMGRTIARLHAADLVHGDLTTSNMIIRGPAQQQAASGGGDDDDKGGGSGGGGEIVAIATGGDVDMIDAADASAASSAASSSSSSSVLGTAAAAAAAAGGCGGAGGGGGERGEEKGQDPTSSGNASDTLTLIDFGLSGAKVTVEDKGVDLYVLERAMLSTHPDSEPLMAEVLRGYEQASSAKTWKAVKGKFDQVRARGRKRLAFG